MRVERFVHVSNDSSVARDDELAVVVVLTINDLRHRRPAAVGGPTVALLCFEHGIPTAGAAQLVSHTCVDAQL